MSHHHHHHHDHSSTGNLKVAFFLNLFFTVIEIIGGIFTNSLAILSDALHDLGDSLSLGLAWYFQNLSQKGRDSKFSYGYKRFSLLGAIINSIVLIVGSIFIIKSAIPRLLDPQVSNTKGMIILAIFGVIINGAAVLRLKKGSSHNEKVVSLHLLEDVLGWVAVLIGSIVMYFTNWYIIDPILSFGIAAFILFNVYKGLKSSLKIILQAIPENVEMDKIEAEILAVEGVSSIHDLHVWSMDGEKNVLTVHIVLTNGFTKQHKIKSAISKAMLAFQINHCTIETEVEGEECVLIDC
ncbi:MAG: cation diffusion facilitator family transporter [Chitinophagales bacterium]